ncbi:uncharacterized protein FOMMEDRAFT_170559 [Fomitiporia mediterranea MF3/22]|uniref:uncharacterized protein n=1 Tax=Fomitiporia mediterranea (strain MF3/22) TaxID=694068 RepID=UPI000440954B|nr:uncharacterized protein FOMMEDRAFT_170559 [Fomitiporia mediterranea MF3/22]EJC99233.1 hypothetical protein FOMMEDRAFT_170559 [Fomitiporia mediterranea MF3/22]
MSKKEYRDEKSKYSDDELYNNDNVLNAIRRGDWASLRSLSLRPGGFGEDRRHAWPFLLHSEKDEGSTAVKETDSVQSPLRRRRRGRSSSITVKKEDASSDPVEAAPSSLSTESHPDEHQIKLDTDRSFVLYSVEGEMSREILQADLNDLIMSVFRRHPRLSYFQGYHDIITVLFLTLPESDQLLCSEKMSLHRLRDAMGKGLEPLLGLLQILKYLLRLVDSDYAALLERNTPLPYFALSNLLTLFSHDVPTLPLIQHVFDFLLCRPPIIIVYLVAAVTLVRKDEAFRMEQEGEDGMLHSLLSSLPDLSDGDYAHNSKHKTIDNTILQVDLVEPDSPKKEPVPEVIHSELPTTEVADVRSDGFELQTEATEAKLNIDQIGSDSGTSEATSSGSIPQETERMEGSTSAHHVRTESVSSQQTDESHSAAMPGSSIVSDLSSSDLRSSDEPEAGTSSRPASPYSQAAADHGPTRQSVSLPAILQHADALFAQYPPTHPALHISEIMGPKSVMNTWSEDPQNLMSDAEAEAVVSHPELIALPFVDPDEAAAHKEAEESASNVGRIRRKLRKRMRRKHFGVRLDKKTVFTGTVVALSVAAAIYSMRGKNGNGGILHISRSDRSVRKTAKVVSEILIGGSERLLETFGW